MACELRPCSWHWCVEPISEEQWGLDWLLQLGLHTSTLLFGYVVLILKLDHLELLACARTIIMLHCEVSDFACNGASLKPV